VNLKRYFLNSVLVTASIFVLTFLPPPPPTCWAASAKGQRFPEQPVHRQHGHLSAAADPLYKLIFDRITRID
jgi:hypothetical protein